MGLAVEPGDTGSARTGRAVVEPAVGTEEPPAALRNLDPEQPAEQAEPGQETLPQKECSCLDQGPARAVKPIAEESRQGTVVW